MKKFLLFVALLFATAGAFAHVYEIRVNQAQDGSLTWYLLTYHSVNECGHANAGLTINGVNYPIDAEFAGDASTLSPNVFAYIGSSFQRASYATVHTPFLGTTLSVAPYSNNVCWAFSVGGSGNFTPPPPPVCTSCPVTTWSSVMAASGNNNGTLCVTTDDKTTATIQVNHLSCASITGDKQFRVVFDPAGANVAYGPFNYSAGVQTNVVINVPYGTTNSTQVKVIDDDFPCEIIHGLTIPGGQYLGEKETTPPSITCPGAQTICANVLPDYTSLAVVSDNCTAAGSIVVTQSPAAGSNVSGNVTVVLTATDAAGNQSSCSFPVTAGDTQKPTITCPANQVLNLDASCNATLPDYKSLVSFSDNCTATSSLVFSQSPAAGTLVNAKGAMIVTFTVTDAAGNFNTCNITVDKKDVTAPTINCPAPINVVNNVNLCGAIVTYALPTAADNCSGSAFNFFNSGEPNNSGSEDYLQLYNNGTWNDLSGGNGLRSLMEVNFVTTNAVANFALIGSFGGHTYYYSNLTQSWPSARSSAIAAGGDLASINTLGESQFLAPYGGSTWVGGYQDHSDPSYVEPGNSSQNFGGWKWVDGTKLGAGQITITQIAGLASGSVFPIGPTTNTFKATDESGNFTTCSFVVTVTDNQLPLINCPAAINHASDAGVCTYTFTPATPSASDNCPGVSVSGVRSDALPLTAPYPFGTTTITWTAKDASNNERSCTQSVTVTDIEKPVIINLPASFSVNAMNNNCATQVTWTKPTASDNCGVQSIVSSDVFYDISGATFLPVGVNTITYTVTDIHNNVTTASFNITVVDNQAPFLTGCPGNITVNAEAGKCDNIVNWTPPTASDNCPGVGLTTNHIQGERFPVGTTVVTYTATDHGGLTTICTFNVTVVDNQLPVIVCPADISKDNDLDKCGATIVIAPATATDNCPGVTVTGVRSDGLPLSADYPVGTTTILWTATDAHSLTATCTQTVIVKDKQDPVINCAADISHTANTGLCSYSFTPVVPVASDNCPGVTVSGVRNDGQPLNATYPVGVTTITWTATDAYAHSVSCSQTVTVTDDENPVMNCPSNITHTADAGVCTYSFVPATPSATDNCPGVTVTGTRSDAQALNAAYPSGTTTISWKATDAHGHFVTCTQTITVTDNERPSVTCPAPQNVDLDASCNAVLPDYRSLLTVSDNCTPVSSLVITQSPAAGTILNGTGNTAVTFTITDAAGNSNTCGLVVTRKDVIPPTIVCASPIEVSNDNGVCGAVVNYALPSAADNCASPSGSQTLNFSGSIVNWTVPAGVTKINIKALGARGGNNNGGYGGSGNGGAGASIAGDFTVVPGQVLRILVAGHGADANGNQNVLNTGGGGGSFVWNSTTGNTLLLAAGGGSGLGTCNSQSGAPGLATLGGSGAGGLGGSFNCGLNNGGGGGGGWFSNGTGTPANFNIGGISPLNGGNAAPGGNNPGAGGYLGTGGGFGGGAGGGGNCGGPGGGGGYNGGKGGDNILCGGATQHVTGGTSYNVGASQVNLSGANAGDGLVIISYTGTSAVVTQTAGLPSGVRFPIGTTTNTFVATDASGNTATCSFTVTVNDTQRPTIISSGNQSRFVDNNDCGANVTVAVPVTADNCGVQSVVNSFNGTNNASGHYPVGTTTVNWTVTDIHNNTQTTSQNITVIDNQAPSISIAPITVNSDAGKCGAEVTLGTPATADNCGVAGTTNNGIASGFYPVGTTVVTWTVTDVNHNTNTTTQNVTVLDIEPPVVYTQDLTIQLDASGNASITAGQINNGSTDNCAIASYSLDQYTFTCANTGHPKTVTLTVTDIHGNSSQATAIVTVQDITPAVVITKDITVQLNASGTASIAAADVNNGSNDACGIASMSVSPNTFSCANVGTPVTVTLTVTDVNGNVSSAPATVTVEDNVAPNVITKSITVQLNASGTASIVAADVDNGSSDACGIASMSVSQDAFSCANVGAPVIVILTVTDIHGNTSTAPATVTVEDNVAPNVITKNITIQLDASGAASIAAADVNNGSSDACGIASISVSPNAFSCANVGTPVTVTLTVTDIHGNASSAPATVTVEDNIAPNVITKNITVQLNAAGTASIVAADVNNGSTDACGIASLSVSPDAFSCANVGTPVIVTLTVTDIHGNVSSKQATVKVEDNVAPVLTTPATQVFCANPNGSTTYTIPALTASDNCGIATAGYVVTFGGQPVRSGSGYNATGAFSIGTSTITWTVKDVNSNTSISTTTVTVNPLPVASLVSSNADAFCNSITLTASSTLTPATYRWVLNGSTFSPNQQISLGLTNTDGIYSVFATVAATGCISVVPATYNYQKQNLASSYTILAYKEVELGRYNKVASGSVGVMTSKGDAEFNSYSSVNGAGSFVKAPKIDKKGSNITITTSVIGVAAVTLPTMQFNTASAKYLPNYTASVQNASLSANYNNLTIKKGISVTLTGNIYGTIKLEEGASVKFTNSTLNIESLTVDKGAKNGSYSYVRFAPNTSVRVSSKVSIGSQVQVNPESNKVTFYMGDLKSDEEKFTVKGGDTRIIANVFMPDGKLRVTATDSDDDDHENCDHKAHSAWSCKHKGHDHNDCNHQAHTSSTCGDDVFMTGLFIAEEVESKGNTVTWNSFNCSATPSSALNSAANAVNASASTEKVVTTTSEETLKVTVMPNPSTTYFTLKFESKYETPLNLRVMDASGRVVDAKSKVGSNSTIQIGHNYSSGTYYAEILQGTERKVIQLIKAKG